MARGGGALAYLPFSSLMALIWGPGHNRRLGCSNERRSCVPKQLAYRPLVLRMAALL